MMWTLRQNHSLFRNNNILPRMLSLSSVTLAKELESYI